MRIELKRGADGPSSLACVRDDGSRTWSRVHPFLPEHDLTHCAVETVLGLEQAFFGLIAAGWGIDDFARSGAARRLPVEAVVAEHVVGMFDRERGAGARLTAGEFNEALTLALRG